MKNLVDERDRDRAFAHCRSDAFDVAPAHVTDRKHCGKARFEEMRRPHERPFRGRQFFRRQVGPRLDESVRVEHHTPPEPDGVGNRARHDEDVMDVERLDASRRAIPKADAFETVAAFERSSLPMQSDEPGKSK